MWVWLIIHKQSFEPLINEFFSYTCSDHGFHSVWLLISILKLKKIDRIQSIELIGWIFEGLSLCCKSSYKRNSFSGFIRQSTDILFIDWIFSIKLPSFHIFEDFSLRDKIRNVPYYF